jgi:hypothetical protein
MLGRPGVDTFHSYGGTAVTLAAGRIAERPVVRAGTVTAAPTLCLGLTFDHRVIDGATAAEVLNELVDLLEGCDAAVPGGWDESRHRLGRRRAHSAAQPGRSLAPDPGGAA